MSRAQTTLDFAIGAGVFLLAVSFTFAFLPGVLGPFTGDAGGDVVVAERAAARVVGDLGHPGGRVGLDGACTAEFFDADGDVGGCRYAADASDLAAAAGVDPVRGLNVTVERNGSVVTRDGVALAAGSPPASGGDVTAVRRVVLLDGRRATLTVRAW